VVLHTLEHMRTNQIKCIVSHELLATWLRFTVVICSRRRNQKRDGRRRKGERDCLMFQVLVLASLGLLTRLRALFPLEFCITFLTIIIVLRVCRVATCDCASWKMNCSTATVFTTASPRLGPISGTGIEPGTDLIRSRRTTTSRYSVIGFT
jgi:hypothetical protein